VPFNPNDLDWADRNRMMSFVVSDYSFNTLLHQSHQQKFRYSAAELLNSSTIQDQLVINCSSRPKPQKFGVLFSWKKSAKERQASGADVGSMCSVFENLPNFDQQQFNSNDTGDLVFTTNQRAPSVIVYKKDRAYFDASNGILELFAPKTKDQSGKLLARAEVQILRGEFYPKMKGLNITGSVNITDLIFSQSSTQSRSIGDQWLSKLGPYSKPVLTAMFNGFFDRYAQFPIPLLDGYNCTSPTFSIGRRSMQIDCDIQRIQEKDVIVG